MILPVVDSLTVATLIIIGFWLEGIGGKRGLLDVFFTPLSLGLFGIAYVLFERL